MSSDAFSTAVSRAMRGIQPKPREEDADLSAAASFLLAAKKQPVPETIVPPPPPIAPDRTIDANNCSFCQEPVLAGHDSVARKSCGHALHVHCFVALLRSGRQYCAACPAPAMYDADAEKVGGYTVDVGNDADVRAAMVSALEYRREKATMRQRIGVCLTLTPQMLRAEHSTSAYSVTLDPFSPKDAALLQRRQWGAVPQLPGGAPPPPLLSRIAAPFRAISTTGNVCTAADCGGPTFCLHRFLDPISTRAALAWRKFDVSDPFALVDQKASAKACVDALFRAKAHPADMFRCGADAERLAALGFTIEFLVCGRNMPFDDVIAGLHLNWDKLLVLGWHPSMFRHRLEMPVVSLVKSPISLTADELLGEFELSYDALQALNLTTEELCALGFRVPLLAHIGMQREHIVAALCRNDVIEHGGVSWYCKTMGLTKRLFSALPARSDLIVANRDWQTAYASVLLHFTKLEGRV